MKQFFLGVDLGQAKDYTALTLTERIAPPAAATPGPEPVWRPSWQRGWPEDPEAPKVEVEKAKCTYVCHKLKRMRGVSYADIIKHVTGVMEQPQLADKVELVVDGTGIGRGVVDSMRDAGLSPYALTITSGKTVTRDDGYTRVPKIELVTVMQMLLQDKRLEINREEPDASILTAELLNFRAKITTAANMTFGAGAAPDWREGAHDDLVLSLAIAMWRAEKLENQPVAVQPVSFGYIY